jgi:hypothetical protein
MPHAWNEPGINHSWNVTGSDEEPEVRNDREHFVQCSADGLKTLWGVRKPGRCYGVFDCAQLN